jgi:hypothetical protein
MKQLPSLRLIEVRSYKRKPGTAGAFHAAASELAVPLLQRRKTDVVAFDDSAHEKSVCFPARACGSRADVGARQSAFLWTARVAGRAASFDFPFNKAIMWGRPGAGRGPTCDSN